MKQLLLTFFIASSCASMSQPPGVDTEHLLLISDSKQDPWDVKTVVLNTGVELEYIEQGNKNGTPVIFLHGLSDSWHSFEAAFKHLPGSIHAFAISQRGHGNSSKPVSGYTSKDFADDVAAFIKIRNLKKAIVVGHSLGGINTLQFAISYPELTKAIVIVDSDPVIRNNKGMPEFHSAVKDLQGKQMNYEFMLEFQRSTLAKPIDSAWFDLLVDEGMKCPVPVFKEAMNAMMGVDLTTELKKLKMPVLIFWGDQDLICLKKGQDEMKRLLQNEKSITYKGTGHALHWEEPQRFALDLSAFIDDLAK